MTHRERVLAVLNRKPVDVIPSLGEVPMDITCLEGVFKNLTGDEVQDQITIARFFDNSAVDLDLELQKKIIKKDETECIYEYPTKAVWRESYSPVFCRGAIQYPIQEPEDIYSFQMPEIIVDQDALKEKISILHEEGYFVQGHVIGGWASTYYYLTSFENALMWMLTDPEAMHHMMHLISEYSLTTANIFLECGADCIMSISDLGSSQRLLFSKELFRKFVYPWLKDMSDLCHSYGRYFHLHSHGHIQDIVDDMIEAGVDILNPVGPSDHNDLEMFKEKWGDKIVFMGGISTKINTMSEEEIQEHVNQVVEIGKKGGGFFPRTESGVPPMSKEKTLKYIEILKEARKKGYHL